MNILDDKKKVEDAVRTALNIKHATENLGLVGFGSNCQRVKKKIQEYGIDTSHFSKQRRFRSKSKWTNANNVKDVVATSTSIHEVLTKMNVAVTRTSYNAARKAIHLFECDTSHFTKKRKRSHSTKTSLENLLVEGSTYSTNLLKHRLINEGVLKNACTKCGNPGVWLNEKLVLHLDHINGVRNDHRLQNLRLLCPNCHSQTGTYGGRNKKVCVVA